jgi:hypothetical protein
LKKEIKQWKDIHEIAMKEIENLKKEVKISNDKVEKQEGKKEKRSKNIILQWAKLKFIKREGESWV